MKYHQIIRQDTANGIGIRISLFVSGCNRHCPECHNKVGQDFNYGWEFTEQIQEELFQEFRDYPIYNGLSILGGEPFEPTNTKELALFVTRFKNRFPDKTLWIYTGYTYEELLERVEHNDYNTQVMLKHADVLVDGPFEIQKKNLMISYRGSSNQRIIDLKASRETNQVILLNFDQKRG